MRNRLREFLIALRDKSLRMRNNMVKNESKIRQRNILSEDIPLRQKEGAQAAKDELAAIKYMSSKTDSTNAKQVYILYHDIIDKKLFNTLIGMNYLKELHDSFYIFRRMCQMKKNQTDSD